MSVEDDIDAGEDVCGWSFDHDTETTYDEADGWAGVCRNCGAEFWEDAPDQPPPPAALPVSEEPTDGPN